MRKAPPPPHLALVKDSPAFQITSGKVKGAQKIVIYGPGGVGKSTLASLAPKPVIIDIEYGTREIEVARVEGVSTFAGLQQCLDWDDIRKYETVIIDSATRAEEMVIEHIVKNVPHEKGHQVNSIEGYPYGKGFQFVYDTFLHLMARLDVLARNGQNVILLAHECVESVPNPAGEDWIRYEPQLQRPRSGKASIRNRIIQWADHVLYLGYDVITEDGKGRGGGSRTIWPVERPTHLAKSRRLAKPLTFNNPSDSRIWDKLLSKGESK